jgi:hypothetical protein
VTDNMFDSPLKALVSRYNYDELFAPGPPAKSVVAGLKWVSLCPAVSVLTKPLYEGANLLLGKAFDEALAQLARVIIEEFKGRDQDFEEFKLKMRTFEAFVAEQRGASLLQQSLGASQRTADPSKLERIGRILLNAALRWPRTDDERELKQQEVAEFTRIAEILTDTDVLVLRAIYDVQSGLVERYRETLGNLGTSQEGDLEASWIQQVFESWKQTKFFQGKQALSSFNVRSALIRLESQGLIGATHSQTVVAQITSTPYGLLELGKSFVESAIRQVPID